MASNNYKIDLRLLSMILNAATAVMLIGGLLVEVDWRVLLFVGILGYTMWGVVNYMARKRDKKEAALRAERKRKKNKVKNADARRKAE
ncbi:MAG: hypothetical protein Q4F23_05020 [Coriobacteriia bacterium]|nr:hypothetical protein [Coriobacteriia bacterium]